MLEACLPAKQALVWKRRIELLCCMVLMLLLSCYSLVLSLFFYFLHPSLTVLSFLNPGVINDPVSEFLPLCNFIFLISALQTFSQLFLELSNYLRSLSQVYAVEPCQCGASRSWHTWDKLQRHTEMET